MPSHFGFVWIVMQHTKDICLWKPCTYVQKRLNEIFTFAFIVEIMQQITDPVNNYHVGRKLIQSIFDDAAPLLGCAIPQMCNAQTYR